MAALCGSLRSGDPVARRFDVPRELLAAEVAGCVVEYSDATAFALPAVATALVGVLALNDAFPLVADRPSPEAAQVGLRHG
jgi:hypothetical protein